MLSAPPSAAFSGPLLSFPFACEEATLPRPGRRWAVGLGQDSFLCVCQCSINYAVGRFGPSSLSLDSLECEPDLTTIDPSGSGGEVLPNIVNFQGQGWRGRGPLCISAYHCVVPSREPWLFSFFQDYSHSVTKETLTSITWAPLS